MMRNRAGLGSGRRWSARYGLLTSTILTSGLLLVLGPVPPGWAACAPGNPGAFDVICSGSNPSISLLFGSNNSTAVLQGATVAPGGAVVTTTGAGSLGFAMDAGSSITAVGADALFLSTGSGPLSSTASPPNSSGINGISGALSATGGVGINASSALSGGTITLQTNAGGTVSGTLGGIRINGADAVTLSVGDTVTSSGGIGIFAATNSLGAAVNVSGTGAVNTTGGGDGIVLRATNVSSSSSLSLGSVGTAYSGSVIAGGNGIVVTTATGPGAFGNAFVNMSGSITAQNGRGIFIGPTVGGGGTSVTMNGATLSSTNGDGIHAVSTSGSANAMTIVNNAAITTAGLDISGHLAAGIFASTGSFLGNLSVTGSGSINAAGTGIDVAMTGAGSPNSVSVGSLGTAYTGAITAQNGRGVNATTIGNGALLVHMGGPTLSSTNGDGIHAEQLAATGSGAVTVVNNTAITATGTDAAAGRAAAGIYAATNSLGAAVNVSGTGAVNTTGGGDGIVLRATNVSSSSSLSLGSVGTAYSGSVIAGGNGIVVTTATGPGAFGNAFVNMSGSITAQNGRGIFIGPTVGGGGTSVTMNGAALSSTNGDGIHAVSTSGSANAMTIVNNAAITTAGLDISGHLAAGIFASTGSFLGNLSVTGSGSINAAGTGIDVAMTGAGSPNSVSVGSLGTAYTGAITAQNGRGVNATTIGNGALLVHMGGPTLSSTNGDGIHAEQLAATGSGAVTVVNNTAITATGTDAAAGRAAAGIYAATNSLGAAVNVSGTGAVNTTGGGDGIVLRATNVSSSSSLALGSVGTAYSGSVIAGGNGIVVTTATGPGAFGNAFVNMSGSITAQNGRGIFIGPTVGGGGTSVTMNGAALSSTNGDGIHAVSTSGSANAMTIVNNAAITTAGLDISGHLAAGIFASTGSFLGNLSVTGSGSINAAGTGIDVAMTGAGSPNSVSVGSLGTAYTGAITAQSGPVVSAVTAATGALLVNLGGQINASGTGVLAETTSTGPVTVATAGAIAGVTGPGSKASTGIRTLATTGPTSITVGNSIAATDFGVFASSTTGAIDVVVNAGASIDPACGICLSSTSGNLTFSNLGSVIGGSQAGVSFAGGANNTLTNFGAITSEAGLAGLAVFGDTGNNVVNNFGIITGSVTLGSGANVFNNQPGATFNAGPVVVLGAANTLTNAGTLAPGGVGVIQTTALTGHFVHSGSGAFSIDANAAGHADRLTGSGTATLNGGTVRANPLPGAYGPSTTYTILTGSAGRAGTFSGATSSVPFLIASLSYDADDVFLTLTRDTTFFQAQANTPNQRAVAGALDTFPTDNPLFLNLNGLGTGGALRAAFDAVSGEVHPTVSGLLADESLYVRSAILGRLRQSSYSGDARLVSPSFGGPQVAFADKELNAVLAYAKAPKAPTNAPTASRDIAFWAQGFGAWGKFRGDGNAAAVSRDLAGFMTGIDARFGTGAAASRPVTQPRATRSTDVAPPMSKPCTSRATAVGPLVP